jgi:hypothetical protein
MSFFILIVEFVKELFNFRANVIINSNNTCDSCPKCYPNIKEIEDFRENNSKKYNY